MLTSDQNVKINIAKFGFPNRIVSFDNGRLTVFELDSGFPVWDGAISYVSGTSELENLIESRTSLSICEFN